jgi:hypothetical protein
MKTKWEILEICFLILITYFTAANAGEVYRWVDENGVTRFSDSPTDRDALIKNNAKTSSTLEPKTSAQTVAPVAPMMCPDSNAPANPFLGKWKGDWAKYEFKGPFAYDSYHHKAIMVVRDDCKLEYQYEGEPRKEYDYKILDNYLLGDGQYGKTDGVPSTLRKFSFRLTKEGRLEGSTFPRLDHWGCLFEKAF